MASFDYNPITGQLDLVGSGGGTSYIDGDVEYHSNLPVTVGTPAVNSAFLVRKGEGVYFINRKPAGIWVRELNNGNLDDWKYAGTFSDLYRDANFRIINDADTSKELAFSLSAITTGTTRTIAVPDKNITLDDAGDSRTPSSHAASHASAGSDPVFDQDLNTGDAVTFSSISTTGPLNVDQLDVQGGKFFIDSSASAIEASVPLDFGSPSSSAAINTRTNLGLGTAATADIGTGSTEVAAGDHGHGNINSSGQVGTTANLPLKTGTGGIVEAGAFGTGAGEFAEGNHTHTQLHDRSHAITSTSDHTAGNHKVFYSDGSGQIQELALGNSGEVLTSNGATSAPSFAAASGGVSAIGTSAADILSVSGSDLVADDPNADRLVMYDDSASKLTHATAGKGLSFDGTTLNSAQAFPVDPISRGATYISYIGGQASSGNSSSAVNTSGGFVIFAPVYIRKSGNYTTFSCIVSTAGSASSLGKMALYTIDPTDATPDALVCESGTFATDSTGIKQPTMTSTFVNEGWYYMALGTNSTTNMAFYGDAMGPLRSVFSGAALNTPAVLLDYSQKLYADFWPNPWDGTSTTFRNAFHPITSLT